MTQTLEALPQATRMQENGLVAGVSLAHFVSHVYIVIMAPLLIFIRQDYDVTYTQIGLAVTTFNLVSTMFQTPVGFLVDRTGPRLNLIAGLILGGAALTVAGLVDSFWVMVAMFGVLGLANTVYHPADYAMLSYHVAPERMGPAFSIHTFAGLLGTAAAPPALLLVTNLAGWRMALIAAGALGFFVAVILMVTRDPPRHISARPRDTKGGGSAWKLLLTAPILLNFIVFTLFAMFQGGFNTYLVAALHDLHQVPVAIGNTVLTTMLFLSAGGVLVGGLVIAYAPRYVAISVICLLVTGTAGLVVALFDLGSIGFILVLSLAGLASGVMSPARDLIVKELTPPGAFGAVFGFVTNGYTVAGVVSPLLFGMFMDHGTPRAIFLTVALAALLCVVAVLAAARYIPERAKAPAGAK